ncbi:MAG: DciA family protein [Pseudomonadota bacterium]
MSSLASKLLDPVMRKRAGMSVDLLAVWPEIVGFDKAAICRPQKVKWAKRASQEGAYEPATLVIRCEPAASLFLQHDTDTILKRVNAFFGFEAVSRVEVVQGTVRDLPSDKKTKAKRSSEQRKSAETNTHLRETLDAVEDPDLRRALKKMGAGVFSKGSDETS